VIQVLVVEDEPLLLMMALDLVEDIGFEVFQATNADDALRLLEAEPGIRIIWTDIDIPGSMNGLVFATAVRERYPPIEILVVSAMAKPLLHQMPERGIFFTKPYNRKELAQTLIGLAA
jgi:CheY-like chemotaxis protein